MTQAEIVKKLSDKWKESGYLDGIKTLHTGSMAELLESEASKLLKDPNYNPYKK